MTHKETIENQLGLNHGTAKHRLLRMVLFSLVQEVGKDQCFKCGDIIKSVDELSIEHKVDWLHSDDPKSYFFDVQENIAFSHQRCNKPRPASMRQGKTAKKDRIEGKSWCSRCQTYLFLTEFPNDKSRENGLSHRCRKCWKEYRSNL